MTSIPGNYVSIGLSLVIHLVLLGILAFVMMEPQPGLHWYEVEYRDPLVPEEAEEISEITNEPVPEPEAAAAKGVIPETQPPRQETRGSSETAQNQLNPAASDLIETPGLWQDEEQPGQVDLGDNPVARGALRGVIGPDDAAEGSSINYKVTGGRVRFSLPADYKHELGASGSVTLQFKLDEFARPIQSSIVPLQQTGPRFYQAARKALLDGTFSFIGAPEPGVSCQITLEFL